MASFKYYFGDNREYGAQDIKDALGILAAEGGIAIELSDGEEYEPSRLNAIVGSAVSAGVVPEGVDSLRLTGADGVYSVLPGKAVFSDGGVAVLEEEESVDLSPGQYLYLVYSVTLDDVQFVASDSEKSDGGGELVVPIGYAGKDGTLTNLRTYAKGKIPALASEKWSTLREIELTVDTSALGSSGGYCEAVHEYEGEMNFLLREGNGYISVMKIGDEVSYYAVYKMSSRETGTYKDKICADYSSKGFVTATLVEKGNGYFKMRYSIPYGYSKSEVTYTALIGLMK